MKPEVRSAPIPMATGSRWRARVAAAHPEWATDLAALAAAPIDELVIDAVVAIERGAAWRDETHLRAGLRRARTRIVAALIDRDLDGRADLDEVLQATTGLAEAAIGEALPFLSRDLALRHGIPYGAASGAPQDLIVIGMGKLGGCELNVSSDVDLIFVHAEDGETRPPASGGVSSARALTATEFFARVGQKLIATLSEVTADGFVFRVDMRLRPDGDAGPLVMHLAMLERYLVTSARDWERFAWIKARVVSPTVFAVDATARDELEALVMPFVYRRYLDFGAIDALRRLHGQIRDEAERREGVRLGRSRSSTASGDRPTARIDVKLGRGGIREIEFIAQHFQLIRGGRNPALRLRPTRATLAELVQERLLDGQTGAALRRSYAFLRNVEHRLQYLDDAQTHKLPARDDMDACERVATMCARLLTEEADGDGTTDFEALVAALQRHRSFVERQFDAVFGADRRLGSPRLADLWTAFSNLPPAADDDTVRAALCERLVASGFDPPDNAFGRLTALARGARLRALSTATRVKLDALVPRLIDAAGATADPDTTLARWLDLVEAIASRAAYLALLEEYPSVRAAVTRLLVASPWAAQYLARHPLLLDELIDAPDQPLVARDGAAWPLYWDEVATTLRQRLARAADDTERQMDLLREVHHVETFRLLIDDLAGHLSIETLSDQLSALADLVIEATVSACWTSFAASRPGLPATPAFAVIAYGKLGGKEIGYVSDLDLVFLFEGRQADAAAGAAAGAGDAMQAYARFAQRLNVWLTVRTSAGALFDIDLRLRPDGAAGLAVSSIDAWARYERREHDVGAGTWEHQALTRARFCAGDRALGEVFEAERVAILAARRSDTPARVALREEVVAMRRRMHDGHPNRSGLFDLKHDEGGMVDIEFAVQYLVLGFGGEHRSLLQNVGNIALLTRAAEVGLIEPDLAAAAGRAYRTYRARQHALRLAEPEAAAARVAQGSFVEERAVVVRLWISLLG